MASTDGATLLSVKNLRIEFLTNEKWFPVMEGANFSVARGKTLGLVGESGSGKTTIGRAALRLVRTSGGVVRFAGKNIAGLRGRALQDYRRAAQIVENARLHEKVVDVEEQLRHNERLHPHLRLQLSKLSAGKTAWWSFFASSV